MNKSDLHFRTATPNDAAELQTLIQSAFRAEDSRPDWTADMALGSNFTIGVEDIMSQITKPDSAVLMATDSKRALVASISVLRRVDIARLSMLVVDQRYQRGGMGRQVLEYAEDYCQRTWNVKKLGLNALSTRQELILWYARRGYQKTGELTPFPTERFKELDLSEDLCFVELEKDLDTSPNTSQTV